MTLLSTYQLVWWPTSWRFGSLGPYPADGENRGCVYRWRFAIGPLEIRRWELLI